MIFTDMNLTANDLAHPLCARHGNSEVTLGQHVNGVALVSPHVHSCGDAWAAALLALVQDEQVFTFNHDGAHFIFNGSWSLAEITTAFDDLVTPKRIQLAEITWNAISIRPIQNQNRPDRTEQNAPEACHNRNSAVFSGY